MPTFIPLVRQSFRLLVFIGLVTTAARAQERALLKLQPHKMQYARQVYERAMANNDSLLLAEAYYLFGKIYESTGDPLTSKRWFLKALRIQEAKGDSYELARLHVRLSDLERTQNHYEESVHHARQAVGISRRIHSDKALLRAYSVMAHTHATWPNGRFPNGPGARPRTDSARYYFRLVEQLTYRSNDPMEMVAVKNALAQLLWAQGDDAGAVRYLKAALAICTAEKKVGQRVELMLSLASFYILKKQPGPARKLIVQAYDLYRKHQLNVFYIDSQLEATFLNFYRMTGQWKQALVHAERLHQLQKANFSADREGAVTRLSVEYETEKKEALLRSQRKELLLRSENLLMQQRFTWTASALLLVTASMSLLFFRLSRKNRRISKRNAELVQEQNHRVKNNLQVVSSLLSLQSNRLTDETAKRAVVESQLRVEAMALLHRRLYDGSKLAVVNLPDFIAELVGGVLRTYGYDHLQPLYDLDALELSATQAQPIGLILNELVSNACKHAFPDHAQPALRISCRRKDNEVTLVVADNGRLPQSVLSADFFSRPQSTFGLRLIQMQVDQVRGSYRFTSERGTEFRMAFKVHALYESVEYSDRRG